MSFEGIIQEGFMQGKAKSPLKAGVHIRVRKSDGSIVDFGEAIEGNWFSKFKQNLKIKIYNFKLRFKERN